MTEYCEPCIRGGCLIQAITEIEDVMACAYHAWVCQDMLDEEILQIEYDRMPNCEICEEFDMMTKAGTERCGIHCCGICAVEHDKWNEVDLDENV